MHTTSRTDHFSTTPVSIIFVVVVVVVAAGDSHLHELRNPELMQQRR